MLALRELGDAQINTESSLDALRIQALADGLPNTPEGQTAVLRLQRYLLVLVDSLDTAWLSTTKLRAFAVR